MARVYAQYLSGQLYLSSIEGYGTDAIIGMQAMSEKAFERLPLQFKPNVNPCNDNCWFAVQEPKSFQIILCILNVVNNHWIQFYDCVLLKEVTVTSFSNAQSYTFSQAVQHKGKNSTMNKWKKILRKWRRKKYWLRRTTYNGWQCVDKAKLCFEHIQHE